MDFHPTLTTVGLFHIPDAPFAFRNWVQKYINEWDFNSIAAAHDGIKLGGAKQQLMQVMIMRNATFNQLTLQFANNPNTTDQMLFDTMQIHENACQE